MNFKRLTLGLMLAASVSAFGAKAPKYVFFFIGDGMGPNQVLAPQVYGAELEGRIGVKRLCMADFPYTGFVQTYAKNTGVTDSAAGGTALATGSKTRSGIIGMAEDKETPLKSLAWNAHENGQRVAILTSVGVNHATPASFYAHEASRDSTHSIGKQLAETGFEFFGGGGFIKNQVKNDDVICEEYAEKNGYTIARSYADYQNKADKADKMILVNGVGNTDLKYRIDQTEGDLTLAQITTAAIDFMMKDPKAGFFMMIEGGKIDYACHGDDAATTIQEVIDMDLAVEVAYDFYKKHQSETLIVIAADHETGSLNMGLDSYSTNLKVLQYQNMSEDAFATHLKQLSVECPEPPLTYEEVRQELTDHFGFWDKVRLNRDQESRIMAAYVETFGMNEPAPLESDKLFDYYKTDKVSDVATNIISEIARISWGSGSHSNTYIPCFAIGVGAENFTGVMENTDIPANIRKVSKWKK